MATNVSEGEVQPKNFSNFLGLPSKNGTGPLELHTNSFRSLQGTIAGLKSNISHPKIEQFFYSQAFCDSLTSIAGLVHVSDLDLTTQILIFPCQTCQVYATKQFGSPPKTNFFGRSVIIANYFWMQSLLISLTIPILDHQLM